MTTARRCGFAIPPTCISDHQETIVEFARRQPGPLVTKAVKSGFARIEGDTQGWHVMSWREDIRVIVRSVLAAEDSAARDAAVGLVHKLGARGYFEFRDLLSADPTVPPSAQIPNANAQAP